MILPSAWATPITALAVWTSLAVPVILGLSRSIPRGLFALKPVDLLHGLVLGIALRLVQGAVQGVVDGSAPLIPSYPLTDGPVPLQALITDTLSGVVIGPVIEELFFRCALLVAVYTVARRRWGPEVGQCATLAVTTILFVAAHALIFPTSVDQTITLALVGLTCGLLVVRTGRVWGAVLTHVTFNAALLLLTVAGTVLI